MHVPWMVRAKSGTENSKKMFPKITSGSISLHFSNSNKSSLSKWLSIKSMEHLIKFICHYIIFWFNKLSASERFSSFFYLPEKIIRAKEWCEGKTVQRPFEAGLWWSNASPIGKTVSKFTGNMKGLRGRWWWLFLVLFQVSSLSLAEAAHFGRLGFIAEA